MANIKEYLDNILNAIFGKDVRQSIHDGIKAINEEVTESIETSQNTKNRQDLLEQKYNEQIENIASSEPQNAEIVDARAGFSTLGSIIKQKVFHFENVEAMKNCLTLIPGDVVQTLGYYSKNDGGEGLYEIVNDSSLEDDGGSIHELNNGLKAKLIERNSEKGINVKQYGIKADGVTDQTNAIQNLIDNQPNIIFTKGVYLISDTLSLNSNSNIFLKDAKIHSNTAINKKYIFDVEGQNNINILAKNATLELEKAETTQQSCIHISKSQNINIKGLEVSKAGGDGLLIEGSSTNNSSNINIDNCIIDNNRRNGISLIGGIDGVFIRNCKISNTNGVSPQLGIDIETWSDTLYNKNIFIENCEFFGNTAGDVTVFENSSNIYMRNNKFQKTISIKLNDAFKNNVSANPQNINIEYNIFKDNAKIYFYRANYVSFNIRGNLFDGGNLYLDSDVSISDEIALKSVIKNITDNIFNNTTEIALYAGQCSNCIIANNTFNNSSGSVFGFVGVRNSTIKNNRVSGYNINGEEPYRVLAIRNSKKLIFEENVVLKTDSTKAPTNSMIYVDASCSDIIIRRNNFKEALYSNLIAFDGQNAGGLFYDNLTNDNINLSYKLPTASAFYAGIIFTYLTGGAYKPYICVNDGSNYVWKQIAYT